MAYSRIGPKSDVYLFASLSPSRWEFCRCRFTNSSQTFSSIKETLDHMTKHKTAGHLVPNSVFEELLEEINTL